MSDSLIKYNNELLSLHAISAKTGVSYSLLEKYYLKFNDIYDAVNMAKYKRDKKNFYILYDGDLLRLDAISRIENVDYKKLVNAFESTGNIYKAISLLTGRSISNNETTIVKTDIVKQTSEKEKLDEIVLRQFYELYNNIYKAIIVTRYEESKHSTLKVNGDNITRLEFANKTNIPILLLNEQLDNKKSAEQIVYEYGNVHSDEDRTKYDEMLNHLENSFGLKKELINKILNDESCTLEQALIRYLFITDNNINDLEKPWLEDVYRYIMSFDLSKQNEIAMKCLLSDREKIILNGKYKQMRALKKFLINLEQSKKVA